MRPSPLVVPFRAAPWTVNAYSAPATGVRGERYRIELPDGSVREGTLDAEELARADEIDPGTCIITFPALDEEAWTQA